MSEEKQMNFKNRMLKEGNWGLERENDTMWEDMTNGITKAATKVLRESKRKRPNDKRTWLTS